MTKRRIVHLPVLLVYSIPYAFLAMYADEVWNTAWLYLPAILFPAALGWFCGKTDRIFISIAGNLLSAASSLLLALTFATEHWNYYFKPFGPMGMLFLLCLVALIPQTLFWRKYRKSTLTYALVFISIVLLLISPDLFQFLALLWPYR